jgi:FkbM family methyltransferase
MKRNRRLKRILTAAWQKHHYVALGNIMRLSGEPLTFLQRYIFGGGSYPFRAKVETPQGTVEGFCKCRDDVMTVNEVFFRLDYEVNGDFRTVVDMGSNIGLSALFFLTRNPDAFAYLFEPNPANHDGLAENLRAYPARYRLENAAVWHENGRVRFGIEPTGRYGRVEGVRDAYIDVEAKEIGGILRGIIAERGEIDVLKIDTEGSEQQLVKAIPEELLPKIKLILCETRPSELLWPKHFDQEQYGSVCRLRRKKD